jgi:hypothetical protein
VLADPEVARLQPNFIAVDFSNIGDVMGVNELNGVP